MIREVKFESQDRRMPQILAVLNANGNKDIEEAYRIFENRLDGVIKIAIKAE